MEESSVWVSSYQEIRNQLDSSAIPRGAHNRHSPDDRERDSKIVRLGGLGRARSEHWFISRTTDQIYQAVKATVPLDSRGSALSRGGSLLPSGVSSVFSASRPLPSEAGSSRAGRWPGKIRRAPRRG